MFASNGILFNHESERRGETFVTRKIALAAANIVAGKDDFVIATGEQHLVREFCTLAFYYAGIELKWEFCQRICVQSR